MNQITQNPRGHLAFLVMLLTWGCHHANNDQSRAKSTDKSDIATKPDDLPTPHNSLGSIPLSSDNWQQIDNPGQDGWDSEVVASAISAYWHSLGTALTDYCQSTNDALNLDQCPSGRNFAGTDLRSGLRVAFASDNVTTHRSATPSGFSTGNHSLRLTLQQLAAPWRRSQHADFHAKVVRVQLLPNNQVETTQLVSFVSQQAKQRSEYHATWQATWSLIQHEPNDSLAPEIVSLRCISAEESVFASPEPMLTDVTSQVVNPADVSLRQQFGYGMHHWLMRNHDQRYFSPLGNPGLAVGDVNGDGRDDLFICQEAQLPNRLLIQQPDGTVVDESAAWRVDWLDACRSVLLLDLDNDGDQDLVVGVLGGVILAENADQRFQVRQFLPTHDDVMSLAAADYDADGDIDIYVCVDYPNDYFATAGEFNIQGGAANRVYHDAGNAGENSLFRNDILRRQLELHQCHQGNGAIPQQRSLQFCRLLGRL
ncbi:MAG: FG-GAP repeat protein [Pirellulaceae bacterium]